MIACDLGSNTIRFIEFDCESLHVVAQYEKIVKTADSLHKTSKISDNALARVLVAIDEAKEVLNFTEKRVVAFTTEALRQATNSKYILEQIFLKTSIKFEIITADKEAFLTLQAVKHRLDIMKLKSENFVLVDIGGGSTEVLFYNNNEIVSKSFPLGIVTLTQEASSNIEELLHVKLQYVKKFVGEYYALHVKPESYVSVAGTPTTVAAFVQGMTFNSYESKKINGYILKPDDYTFAYNKLSSFTHEQQALHVGVGREDLILSGILICSAFYEILKFDTSIVIDDGLREGIALTSCLGEL